MASASLIPISENNSRHTVYNTFTNTHTHTQFALDAQHMPASLNCIDFAGAVRPMLEHRIWVSDIVQ